MDEYRLQLASDIGRRDGLGLELLLEGGYVVAEVFRDDASGRFTFTSFDEEPLALDVLRWFLGMADERLGPPPSPVVA